jgi:hypothetical protein
MVLIPDQSPLSEKSDMKRAYHFVCRTVLAGLLFVLLLPSARSAYAQVIVNGSFETQNIQGWTVTLSGEILVDRYRIDSSGNYESEHNIVYPYDVSTILQQYMQITPDVQYRIDAGVLNDSTRAKDGTSYVSLMGTYDFYVSWGMSDGYTYSYNGYNPVRLQQTVHLLGGETLTGWLNYFERCYDDEHNRAYAYVNDTLVWDCRNPPLDPAVDWQWGDVRTTDWIQWSYTVPDEGDYTIAFDALPQCQFHGELLIDDVQVIPEPSSLALWSGFALAGCLFVRRKRAGPVTTL